MESHSGFKNQLDRWVGLVFKLLKKPLFQTALAIIGLLILVGAVYGIRQTQCRRPNRSNFLMPNTSAWGSNVCSAIREPCGGDTAGIPSVAMCNSCHQQIANPSTGRSNQPRFEHTGKLYEVQPANKMGAGGNPARFCNLQS